MPDIQILSPHLADLIAAGEVVERPASVVKELVENAFDAGARTVTVELRGGGATYLRVTDDGCGMTPEDAGIAFLRHATSKLHDAQGLEAIGTMGFRGEALAAISAVSHITLTTRRRGAPGGTHMTLDAGEIQDMYETGCPEGTTMIVRDLFYNTPARRKFLKTDRAEGAACAAAALRCALGRPDVSVRCIRDGEELFFSPGDNKLDSCVYSLLGRELAKTLLPCEGEVDGVRVHGFISSPAAGRGSRAQQHFFCNGRWIRSAALQAALEQAYRNTLLVGRFPACVLYVELSCAAVDVNVHPAKTEVKFLSEKAVFDCVHYGVLGALNTQTDRPEIRFRTPAGETAAPVVPSAPVKVSTPPQMPPRPENPAPKNSFFRTMTPQEYKTFSTALKDAPQPKQTAAAATAAKIERPVNMPLREFVMLPQVQASQTPPKVEKVAPVPPAPPKKEEPKPGEMEQTQLPMPAEIPWRMVGELYNTYIIVEQGDDAFLIDKHAAHERILFEKLKAHPEKISAQSLLSPIPVRLSPAAAGELLANADMLDELGFAVEEFGENTVLLRQIPMDLSPDDAAEAVESLSADLLSGRRESKDTVRDELLHTVACKAAIKAGWVNDEQELLAVAKEVMSREDLKYCPHGRPICVSLSKKQLEKQFKRT